MNTKHKIAFVASLLMVLAILPSSAFAKQGAAASTAPVTAKFSHGGLRVEVANNSPSWSLILTMTVNYCDGTSDSGRRLGFFRMYLSNSFTYVADKPMKSVVINAVNPAPGEAGKLVQVTLRRSCTPSSAVSPLYCKNVELAPVIHRSTTEPISFTGPSFIHRAGLKFPGVDGLVMTQRIHRTSGYRWQRTVDYHSRSRTWSGVIPTIYIPAGEYRNVELVVQDGYGKQAKCRVGAVTVRP